MQKFASAKISKLLTSIQNTKIFSISKSLYQITENQMVLLKFQNLREKTEPGIENPIFVKTCQNLTIFCFEC